MEVYFTPEQDARITRLATSLGVLPSQLVNDVVESYLTEEARFLAAVDRGIAEADRGEFIEEEEMDLRVESMFRD